MIHPPSTGASGHLGGGTLYQAGLSVVLDGPLCPSFDVWPGPYQPFLFSEPPCPPVSRWSIGAEESRPDDTRFVPVYTAGSWKRGTVDGRMLYRFHAGEDRPYLWAEPNADFSSVEIWQDPAGRRQMPPMLHPVDRVLWMGVLAHHLGFIVHSCGWTCNGKTLLFPGVSGAGKTTLCRQLMAEGQGNILSDDRVILRKEDHNIRACGTPWPGDAKQARNEGAPLAALCFIEKSPDHVLLPIRSSEALRRLLEAASVPWFSSDLRDRVLPLLERVVTTVPAFRLGFHPEPGVTDLLLPLVDLPVPKG
jgi:hypothetical protein